MNRRDLLHRAVGLAAVIFLPAFVRLPVAAPASAAVSIRIILPDYLGSLEGLASRISRQVEAEVNGGVA